MTNREKYRFEDFTFNNYQRLLQLALNMGFKFSDYSFDNSAKSEKEIVWRHDVEFSVHNALKMAKIEKEMGIKAYYYFQIHSEFYNIFEKEIYLLAKEIVKKDHYIGLHFDAHFWEIHDQRELEKCLFNDMKLLESLLGVGIKSFSYHNTTPQLLTLNDTYYAGMLNVYAKVIREKYRYCTDSTGIWRYERLEDVLQDNSIKYLQVLTHDGMWQEDAMAPRQRVIYCLTEDMNRKMNYYDYYFKINGILNIDEDS